MRLNAIVLVTLTILTCGNLAYSQDECEKLIVKYTDGNETPGNKWSLNIDGATGKLAYFGAQHLDDPADSQFSAIKALWEKTKPTVAFFEGPNRGAEETDTGTIRKFGESGYVRYLAKRSGISSYSLEPPPAELYKYLATKYPQEKVDTYFLLSEAMRLRTRKNYDKGQIEKEVEVMIAKLTALLGAKPAVSSIAELEAAYKKYWGSAKEWWQAPKEWFDPNKTSAQTGGIFTNDINKLSSDYRDIYMYKLLAGQVNKGERVIAVIGRNHIPMQEAALRCAIK